MNADCPGANLLLSALCQVETDDPRSADRRSYLLPRPATLQGRSFYWRGWAMVAVGVRMFLIAIAVLAVGAVAFLIVTA